MCMHSRRRSAPPPPPPAPASAPPDPPPPPAVAAPTVGATPSPDDISSARRKDRLSMMNARGRNSLRIDTTQPGNDFGSGLNIPT